MQAIYWGKKGQQVVDLPDKAVIGDRFPAQLDKSHHAGFRFGGHGGTPGDDVLVDAAMGLDVR